MASLIKVDEILDSQGNKFDGSQLGNVGKVLQVSQSYHTVASVVANPATPTTVGHTLTITPTSADSKILIQYHFHWGQKKSVSDTQDNMKRWTIYRDGVNICPANTYFFQHQNKNSGSIDWYEQTQQSTISWIDEPNTTNPVTYDLRVDTDNPTQITIYYNSRGNAGQIGVNTAQAFEIGA